MTGATAIAGRYRIEGRLGTGGMSTVLLAFDQRLERHVAVKLLAEHLADDPAFVSRFRREALAAARLVHPNIVQVFDFGFDEHAHQHFIVMEHVPGYSCAELLRDRGHLDVDQAVEIVAQACRGLDYAHRHGVVHRDVKPGNLLVSDSDVVKLADFGIARATDQSSITQVGSVLGTAAYLAPEQARGDEAGPSGDLYSLGVVTYQLLSGRLPYEATSLSELTLRQQRESPAPLARLNPGVPLGLAEVVSMALAIDPDERPRSALALAEAIRAGARGVSPYGRPDAPRMPAAETQVTRAMAATEQPTAATRVLGSSGAGGLSSSVDGRSAVRAPGGGPDVPAARAVPGPRASHAARTATPATRSGTRAPGASGRAPGGSGRAPGGSGRAAARGGAAVVRGGAAAAGIAAQGVHGTARTGRRLVRVLVALLMLSVVFVVAVVVAVVIATGTSKTAEHYRSIITHNASSAIQSLEHLIDSNTSNTK